MAGTIQSSKPTLTGISSTSPSKDVLSVNREGILMERGGPIYMTYSFMTSTSTTLTEEAMLTDVELTTESASSITNVAVADVKEEIFLPILFTDSYGNLMPVIRSTTAEDVYGGTPLRRRL